MQQNVIKLADYQPFSHRLAKTELTFHLAEKNTHVVARLHLSPNPEREAGLDLWLDGVDLKLHHLAVDGQVLDIAPQTDGLLIPAACLPDGPFVLETEVEIAPLGNMALEGLYLSNGIYCSQCEAQGFRKITFYPDRPDVMAPFSVRIHSDMPVLLSNGNPVAQGAGWVEWDDPWPKPSYLFALVAGDLLAHRDRFTTCSGREVALNIWVRKGDEHRCAWAMESLKRAMAWDEATYGREYDLDMFNIVAVDDFNMGAMENKGLNIFNSKAVLADVAGATDDDFARIEAIIAHEYFHNWTGNRITCRDWFQLCLKEGLTVFRDRQFSGDMRSHGVKRVQDVLALRARQFREDQGPLAHAVRPDHYMEINNFYTATVYEKGAELVRMLKLLVGDTVYRQALDEYFTRHDGQAVTIEDWLKVFEDVSGRDLAQFKYWYLEAGTPRITVQEAWQDGVLTLSFDQTLPPTLGQPDKHAKLVPVAIGFMDETGRDIGTAQVLELSQMQQEFKFTEFTERPIVSILRGFSAPVDLKRDVSLKGHAFFLAHERDPFNRWEAGQRFALNALLQMVVEDAAPSPDYIAALRIAMQDASLDPAFLALVLRLPTDETLAAHLFETGHVPDPDRIHDARRVMAQAIATGAGDLLAGLRQKMGHDGPFSPMADAAGRRDLANVCLYYLSYLDGGALAQQAFDKADNMTDCLAALTILVQMGCADQALAAFDQAWRHDRLVMDKWFHVQLAYAKADEMVPRARVLTERADFDWKNPNRFRALMGAVTANHAGFHHISGDGYRFLADWLLRLDPVNPQTASRLSGAFETWPRYDKMRQTMIRQQLDRLASVPNLSRNLGEMVMRMR